MFDKNAYFNRYHAYENVLNNNCLSFGLRFKHILFVYFLQITYIEEELYITMLVDK